MYLLLDECVARSLVEVARSSGHTAQRTIDVAALGRQASDHEIFAFAQQAGAVNRNDFIALADRGRHHAGIILIPSVAIARLNALFEVALRAAEPLFAQSRNLFVEIDAAGRIASFRIP